MKFYNAFKKVSKKIADVQSFILLSLLFFLIAPIFSLIVRSTNKQERKKGWKKWTMPSDTIEHLRKQF